MVVLYHYMVVFYDLPCLGEYTTSSYPDRVSGWLGHMIKDAVTYPCFTDLQIKTTASCIDGVFVLRMKQIYVNEKEVDKFAARAAEVKRIIARSQSQLLLDIGDGEDDGKDDENEDDGPQSAPLKRRELSPKPIRKAVSSLK